MEGGVLSDKDVAAQAGYLALPFNGFVEKDWHVMCTSPSLKDSFLRRPVAIIGKQDHGIYAVEPSHDRVSDVAAGVAVIQNTAAAWLLFLMTYYLYYNSMAVTTGNYIFSYQFFGVQPSTFKGFTMYKDKIIDSTEYSDMHYPVHPSEFIIYGMFVRCSRDGEVIEVVNDMPDVLKDARGTTFNKWNPSECLGNRIRIRSGLIEFVYAGLKQGSIRLRVGDKVKKGQYLAQVGCSGYCKIPFLHFQMNTISAKILPHQRAFGIPISQGRFMWDFHMQCNLIDTKKFYIYRDASDERHEKYFQAIDPKDIRYINTSQEPTTACLVKKTPEIYSQ